MTNRTVSAGRTPRITIENVAGDLSVVGWEGEDLLIKVDEDEMHFSQDGDRVVLSSSGDLALRVPRLATIFIRIVGGDVAVRGLDGDINIDQIRGDASLRDVKNVSIGVAQSDISLRAIRGNISIKNISADASLRDIEGNVVLESIADDLALRDMRGNLNANVGGDVVLYLDPQPGNEYLVHAGDDVMLILPPNANADLEMNGDEIFLDWPGIPFEEESTSRSVILGSGEAKIHLSAGGELRVSHQDRAQQSPEEFGNFAGLMFDWGDFGTQLGAKISRRVEEAARRAANQAERTARRADSKLRAKGMRGRWNWNIDSSSITPPEQREGVSQAERLAILTMLADKKITADEADKLLEALEGGH